MIKLCSVIYNYFQSQIYYLKVNLDIKKYEIYKIKNKKQKIKSYELEIDYAKQSKCQVYTRFSSKLKYIKTVNKGFTSLLRDVLQKIKISIVYKHLLGK